MAEVKEKTVTLYDLRNLPVGKPVVFVENDPKKLHSIASMAYHLNAIESAESGRVYSCSKDNRKGVIVITVKYKTV